MHKKECKKKSHNKKSLWKALALSTSFFVMSTANAFDNTTLPTNGTVVGGSINLEYIDNNRLNIHQGTDRAVINWDSFNIGVDATTEFFQPSSSSIAVNRVVGEASNPTQILGNLKSNGQVMILDGNGIIFGQNSQIDVNGIVATTGDINNQQFMNGDSQINITNVDTGGSIVNRGTITVGEAGLAAFVAPTIDNRGVITAKMGRISLSAGSTATLDLYGDGLVEVAVDDEMSQALISNSGLISARGGHVQLSVPQVDDVVSNIINMDGIVDVSSITQVGGKIVLGGGNVNVTGTLNATGKSGGGDILVGGDYQGKGDAKTSQTVTVSEAAKITSNATDAGDGGKVIVWSDDTTVFKGSIEAKGGSNGGDGGLVETSGKKVLTSTGSVNASAENGKAGQWLLDPNNIIIRDSAPDTNVTGGPNFDSTDDDAYVTTASIEAALNGGTSVTIQTTASGANTQDGDITVDDEIEKTAGGDASLTLKAHNSIFVNADITSTSGEMDVILNSDADNNNAGSIFVNIANITTNGGDFVAGGGLNPLTDYAYGTASNDDGVRFNSANISTGTGNVSIKGHGQDNAGLSAQDGISYSGGSTIQSTTGSITLDGIGGNGIDDNRGVYIRGADITSAEGNINITGQGGTTGVAGSDSNIGIYLQDTTISSTGAGVNAATLNFNGTGGVGEDNNYGVYGRDLTITSVDGDIDFVGQAGSFGTVGTSGNVGINLISGTDISSTGTGCERRKNNTGWYGSFSSRWRCWGYFK